MSGQDTIFALASGRVPAGIAVVRVSGSESNSALRALLGPDCPLPTPRRAARVDLYEPESKRRLDDALAIRFLAPASFTGEDVVELHLHGGRAVVEAVLEALAAVPCLRPAEAGEFTRRAFENGRMDLTEVEGLADLIDAETEMQRRQALAQMEGSLGRLYDGWRDALVGALAYLEAAIDFFEEDLPRETAGAALAAARRLVPEIEAHLADGRRGEILRDGFRVAIVGAPNVGKSSLLNALARRDVAITSETAGTTRDVIETHLDIEGFPVVLADTAGIREADEEIEREGVRRALRKAEDADLRLWVVETAGEGAITGEKNVSAEDLLVVNKCDLVKGPGPAFAGRGGRVVAVSAKTGAGIGELVAAIAAEIARRGGSGAETPALTRARHRNGLEACVRHLKRAGVAWDEGASEELIAEDVRLAARELGRITGRVEVEELLDLIFRDFCIGK